MKELYHSVPPLLMQFLATAAFSFVVGLEFRRYKQINNYIHHFGSARTFVLVGVLGFLLYALDSNRLLYLGGLASLAGLLAVYYWRISREGIFSLFSILIALLIYLLGPISIVMPGWFLVLFVVLLVLILGEKPLIHAISDRLNNEEILTLAKFLILSGVILPLLPDRTIAPSLPVSYYKVWLAVIVVSGISYLSYLINTYFYKSRSLVITGILGGLYSSTAATVVIGRRARAMADAGSLVSSSIILATCMMYARLLTIIFLFDRAVGIQLLLPFCMATALSLLAVSVLLKLSKPPMTFHEADLTQHPLEFTTASLFALLFVFFAWLTHTVTSHYGSHGLNFLAVVVGFTDIDPFILSLLSGQFTVVDPAIVSAVVLASGSNNLLKAAYAIGLARNRSVLPGAIWLFFLFVASIVYAFVS
ncbi:MAG: MgtC/SapB family protein [Gammaproteobacteria bacterium]